MAKLVDVSGRPQSGVVPYAVVGLVSDNDDPDELGRVKVSFPTLPEGDAGPTLSFWLRQASPNAGLERGLYALPEVDDEVLVIFMQGSQDIGVIIGQFWNGVDKPPKEAIGNLDSESRNLWVGKWSSDEYAAGSGDDATNDRRFWRSRSGHIIGFDDTDGAETIQVWDKSGELSLIMDSTDGRIILSNNSGDIHIRTATDLYLEAGNDMKVKVGNDYKTEVGNNYDLKVSMKITTKAGQASKHEAGMNYEIKAGMDFKAKASMNVKIEGAMNFDAKGGIQANVKGLMANLEGSAMAKVKGGVVMIN